MANDTGPRIAPSAFALGPHNASVLVVSLLTLACGRDTDALICAPGRVVQGGECTAAAAPDQVPTCFNASDVWGETIVESTLGMPCEGWWQCHAEQYCPRDDAGFGRCALRCTSNSDCAQEQQCSPAGICTRHGALAEGEPCSTAESCAEGLLCAAEDERCHRLCDPREAESCEADELCLALPNGLGRCLPRCP
ncbi:MAG: hypothetical protein RBU37_17550 [Myxococcota bacterium]|jgi:hypothetical protein|nr:hypothetical protein [Myxococcota bacterium]